MIGRIPILDVQPVLPGESVPARAVAGETFQVTATVFREGHEMLGAAVVLTDPGGAESALLPMRELAPGSDRYGADVTPDRAGSWQFRVEAWGDPVSRWQHDAGIKVPIGQDVELMLAEGALLMERAAQSVAAPKTLPPEEARQARARAQGAERGGRAAGRRGPHPARAAGRGHQRRRHRGPDRVSAARPADHHGRIPADRAPPARPVRRVV